MLFNSVQFLVFFPVVTALYFLLPHKYRWLLLLLASSVFYMAFIPVYILILAFTITIDYFAGRLIESAQGKKRKLYLLMSILANVGVLAFFKYYNFALGNISSVVELLNPELTLPMLAIILPIGLSFHTFQAMSYTIEVYRGTHAAERKFGIFALYVMFYPQLVAGPIERPQNLIHQFYEKHYLDYSRIADGLKLILWGLFKKMVIADRLGLIVDQVYNNPVNYSGLPLIISTIFFAFQIYCDFSGYSDIAIGSAKVMGFKLMDNFSRPYFAVSIADFWRRWHISLSTWFRDYVYIPLGGNRLGKWRWHYNILITFLISGLWHGANWTYVVWGLINGLYIAFGAATQNLRTKIKEFLGLNKIPRLNKLISVITTFSLTCFAWIFFRANSVGEAWYVMTNLFKGFGQFITNLGDKSALAASLLFGRAPQEFLIALGAIAFMIIVQLRQKQDYKGDQLPQKPVWFKWMVYYIIILAVILLKNPGARQFIYFQF